jgi:hypothetical protein
VNWTAGVPPALSGEDAGETPAVQKKQPVIPAKAGTHGANAIAAGKWVPACAGMTFGLNNPLLAKRCDLSRAETRLRQNGFIVLADMRRWGIDSATPVGELEP